MFAVIYPEIREPYRSIFESIVRGIEQEDVGDVEVRLLKSGADARALDAWLAKTRAQAVVALGRTGLTAVQTLPEEYKRIVGAVLVKPSADLQGIWGISLTPDPDRLFRQLKEMANGVERVFVVYNPDENQWLVDRAQESAAVLGLELNAVPASDLREAAAVYRRLLPTLSGPKDAIWLPQDRQTVDDRAILPLILEKAWNGHIVLFSSSPGHVKRGALFSMYPDHEAMGRRLGDLVVRNSAAAPSVDPLRDLKVAVNKRTAEHLGITFSSRDLRKFGLVFPAN